MRISLPFTLQEHSHIIGQKHAFPIQGLVAGAATTLRLAHTILRSDSDTACQIRQYSAQVFSFHHDVSCFLNTVIVRVERDAQSCFLEHWHVVQTVTNCRALL